MIRPGEGGSFTALGFRSEGGEGSQAVLDDLYASWAAVYDLFYPDRSGEVRAWTRLARQHGRQVLDLMCGTAEVSLGLARQGLRVVGVDRSPAMLAVGVQRLAAAADYPARGLRLVQGTACQIPASNARLDFALVSGDGSLNHLDDEDGLCALAELGRVLRPGGGLGLELLNPYLLPEIEPERTFGPLRPTLPGMCLQRTVHNHYDAEAGLFKIHQVTSYASTGQRLEFEESFALYVRGPEDIGAWLRATGFGEPRYFGSHDLEPFGRWSPALLVLATKLPAA